MRLKQLRIWSRKINNMSKVIWWMPNITVHTESWKLEDHTRMIKILSLSPLTNCQLNIKCELILENGWENLNPLLYDMHSFRTGRASWVRFNPIYYICCQDQLILNLIFSKYAPKHFICFVFLYMGENRVLISSENKF